MMVATGRAQLASMGENDAREAAHAQIDGLMGFRLEQCPWGESSLGLYARVDMRYDDAAEMNGFPHFVFQGAAAMHLFFRAATNEWVLESVDLSSWSPHAPPSGRNVVARTVSDGGKLPEWSAWLVEDPSRRGALGGAGRAGVTTESLSDMVFAPQRAASTPRHRQAA
jgi:hypothetical protein